MLPMQKQVERTLGSTVTAADFAGLPEEKYPREIPNGKPDRGYYVALGIVMSVKMITPLSCAYLAWFVFFRTTQGGLTATLFASYALTEVVFALYHRYLLGRLQAASPPIDSEMSFQIRNTLFLKILTIGLKYPAPAPLLPDPDDPLREHKIDLYRKWTAGHITASQYHHEIDREYEEIHGMRETARVARMRKDERELISAFVEDTPGERERRLREEIELSVGHGEQYDEEGIVDKEGNPRMLHVQDRRAVEFRERMRTWFNHAPWSSIKRGNVLVWLAWSLFATSFDAVEDNPEWNRHLLRCMEWIEARTGTVFPPGTDPSVPVIRLTLDPINVQARPLIIYAVSNFANWILREVVFPYQGMALYREGEIDYLIRIPRDWTAEKAKGSAEYMPIIYFHGLGFGLLQSISMISHLNRDKPSHPVVIPLAHHTAQAIFEPRHLRPWGRRELVDAMKGICERWGFYSEARGRPSGGVSVLSHSNGSVAHAWLLKDSPGMIKRNCFVDPVVFCLWEGDLCHAVLYRKPANALQLMLYYFISSEIGTAHYLQRHFDWASNVLFFDDVPGVADPSRTAFFLGGKDMIIDTDRVRRYLYKHGVSKGLHWEAEAGHGETLDGKPRERVVKFVTTGDAF